MRIPNIIFLETNRVWRTYPGGRKLDEMEGIESPRDSHFPEDWIGSTTRAINKGREHLSDEGLSKVTIDGETMTLKSFFETHADTMLGESHVRQYGINTQFLFKLLDSAIRLHIQCHPTIPFAKKYLNSNFGKTEAYVILSIREEVEEPYIYMGFQHPPTKEDFKRMIEEQDIDAILSCFKKIPIKPGDVFIVPGGMPHAIGEGVFMMEIMEPSDFAVRIEFERGGYVLPEESRFMNRGIEFALSMFNFDTTAIETIKERFFCEPQIINKQNNSAEYILIDEKKTKCFKVNKILVKDSFIKAYDTFYIAAVAKGSGTINIGNESYILKEGSKFFVPYQTENVEFTTKEEMEIIVTFPPNSK